ncbi:putative phage R protein [Vibrio mediterranei AK1]|uniref:phage terminase small subunit n=1 Tax=Vibrio mediterranei TaxID=689 RepID=UPI00015426B7|nr:phage terminase small subunit [Vibrio mediterranei]EDL52624.1 putative phage R protein [Vibrio mediterranei AK1]
MISLLMKRKQQLQPMAETTVHIEQSQVSVTARPTFHEKPWEETQATLKRDLEYVRTLSGSQEKDPYKEQLIEKYRPLIEKLRITHKGNYGNLDVMWWWFLWHVDLGKLEEVYDDFRAAIDDGLECPNTWKMNGQTAFMGYVLEYSKTAYEAKKPFNREYLINAVKDLRSGELATNPPLKGKMFRLVGDWHFEAGEQKEAHDLFEQVMKMDPNKGGRKIKLESLRKELGYDSPN